MARFFFALDLPIQTKQTLQSVQHSCVPALPRATTLNNLHLTLVFLGSVDPSNLHALCKHATQLSHTLPALTSICTNHIDVFIKPKVIFAGIEHVPQWLAQCQHSLLSQARKLGIKVDNKPFIPHVTLSRKVTTLPSYQPFNIECIISSFSLYRSDSTTKGVRYTKIQTFTFNNTNQI